MFIPQTKQYTVREANSIVRNKAHFYQAMRKLGWNLPKYSSAAVTVAFLTDVRNKLVYCPLISNFHNDCSDVPNINFLMHEVNRLSKQNYWSNPKRYPNPGWAVDTIASLDSNHQIFKKDYIAKPAKV